MSRRRLLRLIGGAAALQIPSVALAGFNFFLSEYSASHAELQAQLTKRFPLRHIEVSREHQLAGQRSFIRVRFQAPSALRRLTSYSTELPFYLFPQRHTGLRLLRAPLVLSLNWLSTIVEVSEKSFGNVTPRIFFQFGD